MSTVILGPAGSAVLIDLGLCAKTGRPTTQQVTLRGRTTPRWVSALFIFSLFAFVLGRAFAAKPYQVTLPFSHDAHDHWRNNRRWVWGATIFGALVVARGATLARGDATPWFWAGAAILVVALVSGAVNAFKNNVGVWQRGGEDLVLTRVHPDFAQAARAASVSSIPTTVIDS